MIPSLTKIASKPLTWIFPYHFNGVSKHNAADKILDAKPKDEPLVIENPEGTCTGTFIGYTITSIFIGGMALKEDCYVTAGFAGFMAASGLAILASDVCYGSRSPKSRGPREEYSAQQRC